MTIQALSQTNDSKNKNEPPKSKSVEHELAKIKAAQAAIESGVGYSSDKTLAKYFDISRSTVWLWARIGRLPKAHQLTEGTSRWSNSEVKEYRQEAAS